MDRIPTCKTRNYKILGENTENLYDFGLGKYILGTTQK